MRILVAVACAVAGVLALPAVGAAQSFEWVADPLGVAPGSPGVCVTEMDGGERVEIPVTVLGVLSGTAPEAEVILVRLDDPRLERTGVAAGMSGSPVYVGNRLLGALAFAWPFAKEPIAGVTPFARMAGLGAGVAVPAAGNGRRPTLVELQRAWREGGIGELLLDWLAPGQAEGMAPLPLAVAGGAPGVPGGWLAEGWRRMGWVSGGGAAGAEPRPGGAVEPGAMVAGVLISGDATFAVAGTVTAVDGDEVWAFGHPFLTGGGLAMPLARAHVVAVMPSQMVSFKFFSVGEVRGAFLADRSHGVWGRLGETAPTVPVDVSAGDRSYHFQAVRHPVLLPLMVAYLAQASHAARDRTFGDQTVRVRVAAKYAGQPEAVLEDTFAAGDASAVAAGLAGALVAYLEGGPFPVPELERVSVRLDARERLERAELVDAVPERLFVRPGEELGVRVRLRPHRGADLTRVVRLRVPPELDAGRLDLVVADGAAWSAYDLAMRPLRTASFADELRLVERLAPSTHLVVAFERPGPGVALHGGTVAAPAGMVALLQSGLGSNLSATTYRVVARQDEVLPFALVGAQRVILDVRLDRRPTRDSGDGGEEP